MFRELNSPNSAISQTSLKKQAVLVSKYNSVGSLEKNYDSSSRHSSSRRKTMERSHVRSKIRFLRFLKNFQYAVFFGVCGLLLLVQILFCILKYLEEPSYISSFITTQEKAEFPEITVCVEGDSYKPEALIQHGFDSLKGYKDTKNHTWKSTNGSVSDQDLFLDLTRSPEEIFQLFQVRTIRADENGVYSYKPKIGETTDLYRWTTNYHRSFGRCYSLYPAKKLKDLGIYYMKIFTYVDMKLYLHHKGQFLDLPGRMGMKIYRNNTIQMQASWLYTSMLDESVKTVQKGFKCSRQEEYDTCMYNAVMERMKNVTEAGCTVPYMPDNSKICQTQQDRDDAFFAHYNTITNQKGDCPNPCDFLLLSLGGQNRKEVDTDLAQVYFYFQSRTLINEESLLYTPLSLFAEIGGYVGLLMGFSIFHLADLISSLVERKIRGYEKQVDDNEEEMKDPETFNSMEGTP